MSGVYSETSYEDGYPPGIGQHFWHRARASLVRRWLLSVISRDDLVLDVGCGPGIFVASMADHGFNIKGIEEGQPPAHVQVPANVHTGINVFSLPLQEREEVKVILLLDVLEHIEERQKFLLQIWRSFPNCCHLLLTVPARMELWSEFDQYWGHQLRYDKAALLDEVTSSGASILRCSYAFHWLYLAARAITWLPLQRQLRFISPTRTAWHRAAHSLLGWLTVLESRCVPGFIPGSSLICLAARPD